jgi:phosphatidyl-myo-inositol dimannoside synthase
MKILFLTPGCFDKGGISRYSRYQISALRELFGAKNVRVLSLLGPGEDSFEEKFEVHWFAGDNRQSHKARFVAKTLGQVITWRPDIVHVAHVNFSGFAHVASKICGARSVLNVYGLEVWSHLSADARYGLKYINKVISDCHYTARYIEDASLRRKNSTTVIWDCVDLERFNPAPPDQSIIKKYNLPDPAQHFVIMSLGRLSKSAMHKGFDRLIKVFGGLVKKFPDARLVIAGKGDYRAGYEQMVQELGIADKVVFTGMVEENDLPGIYRCAHFFSLVSDRGKGRGEGIPLTPLEAMACGVPVIVGNHDGSQEAVVDEKNGSIIDPFNLQQHEQKLSELITDRELWKQKKHQARQVAEQFFSYRNFIEKHKTFYGEL